MRPRARRIQYRWLACKTLINKVPPGMPFRWSINPYRGCTHGCVYCYARATHPYLGLDGGLDFESVIFVKADAVKALRRDLGRPGWNRELVAIGTATDPYQPIEGKYRLMRGILRELIDAGTPFSITTKSTLVLRDLDLLVEATRRAGCTVNLSVPTVDPALWRQLEPGTPHPYQRLRVLQRLREAGVRAGVFLAPILPGITDDRRHLEAVVREAARHGAAFLWPGVLHLGPGVREWVFPALARIRPDLMPMYRALYRGRDAAPFYRESVLRRVEELKTKWGLPTGRHAVEPPRGAEADGGVAGGAGRNGAGNSTPLAAGPLAAGPVRGSGPIGPRDRDPTPGQPVPVLPVAAMAGVTPILPGSWGTNRPLGTSPGSGPRARPAASAGERGRGPSRRPLWPGHGDGRRYGSRDGGGGSQQLALPLPGA
ncbi:radical SAM protein [Thermaerobacter marianensis]|uniref:radical SAM protein n=1 Tax=Thermaerobacter marianensis TaxID=73919 RepID=UPI00030EFFB8|nr:radical SAM protein [Thermaerobacter marianensis]